MDTDIGGLLGLSNFGTLGLENHTELITHTLEEPEDKADEFYDAHEYNFFPFLILPFELRLEIYQICLLPLGYRNRHDRKRYADTVRSQHHAAPYILDLMLTCRSLYAEIFEILPRIASFHISQPIPVVVTESEPQASTPGLIHYTYVHPLLRRAKTVKGQWLNWEPTIPFEVVQNNKFSWHKVEMGVNVKIFLNNLGLPENKVERIRNALVVKRDEYKDISSFIHIGTGGGVNDSVSVTVLFRIQDSKTGVLACSVLLRESSVKILRRVEEMPSEEEMNRVFRQVFGTKKYAT